MTIKVPKAPDNLVWTGLEQFNDCKYIYVRFEDHSISTSADQRVQTFMHEMNIESGRSKAKTGNGLYAVNADPWLADQLFNHANCLLYGVTRAGVNLPEVHSKFFKPLR